jgi:UDP-N-acetylmuramoyl-tripeptide--D-alanyl-D-alanine ligase
VNALAPFNVEARTLNYAAAACLGELRGGPGTRLFTRVCTDSRTVRAGDLFVALRGERFDGHEFASHAIKQGAAGVLAETVRAGSTAGGTEILVDDTRAALGRLAARYRADFDIPVIAVAGSNGKTSTKEILASVLRRRAATLASEASFNNDIGVPVTLLKLERAHRAAVIEVGTNHPGELAPLVAMARPTLGVITNIGREHLEFFKDLEGVAREEGTLAEALPAGGCLVVNGDGDWMDTVTRRTRARVVRTGFGAANDWRAEVLDAATGKFRVSAPDKRHAFDGEYRVSLIGRHQIANALLAMAVAVELDLSPDEVRAGLEAAAPAAMRMQLREAAGVRVINDAYNANADSMTAALRALKDLPCAGRRVAVLGDMAELGENSGPAHAEIGGVCAEAGVGRLISVGRHAAVTAAAARAAGVPEVVEYADVEAAARDIRRFAAPGDLVLVKASRSARLERIAEALLNMP